MFFGLAHRQKSSSPVNGRRDLKTLRCEPVDAAQAPAPALESVQPDNPSSKLIV
jgi:hypothetical protein